MKDTSPALAAALCLLLASCQTSPHPPLPGRRTTGEAPSTEAATRHPNPPPTPSLITPAPTPSAMTAQSMASPDNDWRATASFENLQDGFRVRLLVTAHDGTAWSPIDIAGDGVGYTYPSLKYWSPDSRYFFFAERVAGGSCDFFPIEDHWKRLDVRTGKLDDYPLP